MAAALTPAPPAPGDCTRPSIVSNVSDCENKGGEEDSFVNRDSFATFDKGSVISHNKFDAFGQDVKASMKVWFDLDEEQGNKILEQFEGVLRRNGVSRSATSLSTLASSGEDGSHGESDEPTGTDTVRVVRVEQQYRHAMKVDSRDTIVRSCCGIKISNLVYKLSKKLWCTMILSWFVGNIVGVLGVTEVIPASFAWLIILTLPSQAMTFLMLNRTLAYKLLAEWESWYCIFLCVAYTTAMVDAFRSDPGKVAAFTLVGLQGLSLVFNDARHAGSRATKLMMGIVYACGAMLSLVLIALVQLGATPGMQTRRFVVSLGVADVQMDTVHFANYRLLALVAFTAKNAYLKLRHPDSFAVIKARITSARTTEEEFGKPSSFMKARFSRIKTLRNPTHIFKKIGNSARGLFKDNSRLAAVAPT